MEVIGCELLQLRLVPKQLDFFWTGLDWVKEFVVVDAGKVWFALRFFEAFYKDKASRSASNRSGGNDMLFASHLTEHFSFIEIIWKLVRSFLEIEPILVSANCINVTYRSSSRPVAQISRIDRRLVQLENIQVPTDVQFRSKVTHILS